MRYRIVVLVAILTTSIAVCAASVRPFGTGGQSRGASSVCGRVAAARHAVNLRGEPVFLTLRPAGGDQDLTVVIMDQNRAGAGSPEAMVGRHICVSGRFRNFFGERRMLLESVAE